MPLDAARMRELIEAGARVEIVKMGDALAQLLAEYPALSQLAEATMKAALNGHGPTRTTRGLGPAEIHAAATEEARKKKRSPMSDAGRARLRASMKKRWALAKKAGNNLNAKPAKKGKDA